MVQCDAHDDVRLASNLISPPLAAVSRTRARARGELLAIEGEGAGRVAGPSKNAGRLASNHCHAGWQR